MTDKNDALEALNLKLENDFGSAIDLNADIINATRVMAHKLLVIRNGHLAEADRILEIVTGLAESAQMTADLLADTVAAEWGIEGFVPDEDAEDEDDDEE